MVEIVKLKVRVHLVHKAVGPRQRDALAQALQLVVVVRIVHPPGAVLQGIQEADILPSKVVPAQELAGGEGQLLLICRRQVDCPAAHIVLLGRLLVASDDQAPVAQ